MPADTQVVHSLPVLPTFPALPPARVALRGSPVRLFVEVGHAERRRVFGETDELVGAKVVAALRNHLVPIVCVGESEQGPADSAADQCVAELERILAGARTRGVGGRIVVAYEPRWAINAPRPAPVEHIGTVCGRLNAHLSGDPEFPDSRSIYGGSAGPGLLTALRGQVRGLFLGRYAHDPSALAQILDETLRLQEVSACRSA